MSTKKFAKFGVELGSGEHASFAVVTDADVA